MQSKPAAIDQPFAKSTTNLNPKPALKSMSAYNDIAVTKRFSTAVACINSARHGSLVFRHTKAVASGLDLPVQLIHVMQGAASEISPSDPIEWQLKQREAQDYLSRITETENEPSVLKDRLLLNGHSGEEIARWAREHTENLMAMTTRCEVENFDSWRRSTDLSLGRTAQTVLEGISASLLLIPPETAQEDVVHYRRLLVPLDGSCRAESVLPFAVRIARKHGAELVLVHIVSMPEIVEASLGDSEANALVAKLRQFNEQNARTYLSRLQSRLSNGDLKVKVVVEGNGDARDGLLQIAEQQDADLFVLSGRGKGAMNGICCGSVARHLAAHSNLPLLLIRERQGVSVNQTKLPERQYSGIFFRESAH